MAERDGLSFIDRLSVDVDAGIETTWEALVEVLTRSLESRSSRIGARLLGSSVREATGPRPLEAGSTIPGFRVTAVETPRTLTLGGEHRFARHEMTFHLSDLGGGRIELAVETRADFPGPVGTLYRALVIGSGSHVLVTMRLLKSVARDAEIRALPTTSRQYRVRRSDLP